MYFVCGKILCAEEILYELGRAFWQEISLINAILENVAALISREVRLGQIRPDILLF